MDFFMFVRTFARTFINTLFKKNLLSKLIRLIVNFYYKIFFKDENNLSFEMNKPLNIRDMKSSGVSFLSVTGDKIDSK